MTEKKVEIFYGDIGTVRNELTGHMKHVKEIVSLTQSVTASANHTNAMLTVVLVYIDYGDDCPEEVAYQPNNKKEHYL